MLHTMLLLATLADGVNVYFKHNATRLETTASDCNVLFLSKYDEISNDAQLSEVLGKFDVIFTDAADLVPFGEVRYPLAYLDETPYTDELRYRSAQKEGQRTLSFLVPSSDAVGEDEGLRLLIEDAMINFPNDVFVDTGPYARHQAFSGYAFSVLLAAKTADLPPSQVVDAVTYGTVPVLVWRNELGIQGKFYLEYNYFFKFAVSKAKGQTFHSQGFKHFLSNNIPDDAIFVYQNAVRVVRDYFFMRMRLPFHITIHHHARAICEEKILPLEMQTMAFFIILSAKKNFFRRQGLRDTWLPMLKRLDIDGKRVRVHYKFFVNAAGFIPGDGTTDVTDILLRYEMEEFDDIVLLDVKSEYPIGNQGRLAMWWAANNTNARFIIKSDDDVYVRPYELIATVSRQQRAHLYMGSFDYSGKVSQDRDSAHYLEFIQEVFPPYARGALIAFSIDLVRLIVAYDKQGRLKRVPIEDVSYGYFLYQLVELEATGVSIVDRFEHHWAMDPKCCTEESHPNNCWSALRDDTWIVHHVEPERMGCMFAADLQTGYYKATPSSAWADHPSARTLAGAYEVTGQGGQRLQFPKDVSRGFGTMASLCDCVYTPPPHPKMPLPNPNSGLVETPDGPVRDLSG
eukprot:GEMP01018344.1.p1 GENE.GEMP01018344.1~~GEMP01018344.1.p1  ORF type:complete len:627 (+),score=136.52 GEMP01018344.1:68-1948(+)